MALFAQAPPVGTSLLGPLATAEPYRVGDARRPWVLLGLLLLCLAPRALMAWKLDGPCPDGVAYIRQAELLDQGHVGEVLRLSKTNPLPIVLVVLHRAGLDWVAAGSLWGVLMSAAVVLPLFGWLRRQFDDRVALAGCFLYAVHSELIRWSPEVIRDPTFWFLFTLSLYLLWRAVTEVRLGLFFAAGTTITMAAATRFEGLLLLIPLVVWSVARWRALRRCGDPAAGGTRLAVGALGCLAVLPAVTTLVLIVAGLRGYAMTEVLRIQPLILAGGWSRTLVAPLLGDTSGASSVLPNWLGSISLGRMLEIYVPTVVKGLTLLWTLLLAMGVAVAWRARASRPARRHAPGGRRRTTLPW